MQFILWNIGLWDYNFNQLLLFILHCMILSEKWSQYMRGRDRGHHWKLLERRFLGFFSFQTIWQLSWTFRHGRINTRYVRYRYIIWITLHWLRKRPEKLYNGSLFCSVFLARPNIFLDFTTMYKCTYIAYIHIYDNSICM